VTGTVSETSGILRTALVQLASGASVLDNLVAAEGGIRKAAARGATFVLLPEAFNYRGPEVLSENDDGPSLSLVRSLATELNIWILAGSLGMNDGEGNRRNTSCVVNPTGQIVARYSKAHLFKIDLDVELRDDESDQSLAGNELVVCQVAGVSIGLSICFDLRFPELYRVLSSRGAVILCAPSNFSSRTGQDHWEPLLRARAIENQAFVLAPAQCGRGGDGFLAYGRSLIVDPWGIVVAQAADNQEVIVADLDLGRVAHTRRALPAIAARRPALYGELAATPIDGVPAQSASEIPIAAAPPHRR
jgi:predicted amidohydrolase